MESKVIVIHHGSHSLRIGLASDPVPKTIPNYIARRRKSTKPNNKPTTNNNVDTTTKEPVNGSSQVEVKDQVMNETIEQPTTTTTTTEIKNDEPMKIDIPVNIEQQPKQEDVKMEIPNSALINNNQEQQIEPVENININISDKLISTIQQSTKETSKLLPPADYIKINQKTTLYNENNSTSCEIIPETKKKKKKQNLANATYQPPQLDYNEIDYCIGEDAIKVSRNKKEWIAYQPIILSTFNTGIYNSSQSMFDDITQMWKYAIQRYLNIPSTDLSSYGCVYVAQDNIDKKNIKTIVSLLFRELQFTSVLLFQESVCSTFGMSVSTQTCVIDIGHQKISICCIDEGYLIPNTRVTLKYGGEQLTKLLEYFLAIDQSNRVHKYYFPFKSSEAEPIDFSPFYLNVFESIKNENLDYLFNDPQKQKVGSFKVQALKQPNQINIYHFNADEVYHFVAMSLFYPEILSKFGGGSTSLITNSKLGLVKGDTSGQYSFNYYLSLFDTEDIFATAPIVNPSTMTSTASAPATFASTATPTTSTTVINNTNTPTIPTAQINDINSSSSNISTNPNSKVPSTSSSTAVSPTKKSKNNLSITDEDGKEIDIPLDTAINKSISQLERSEINKKKYLSNILLVGGGALIPGLPDAIKARVFKQQMDQQQAQFQQQLQQAQQQQQQILQQHQAQQNLLQQQQQQSGQPPQQLPQPQLPPLPQPPTNVENYIGFAVGGGLRQDVDLKNTSWRGGAILGCLESTKEIWITKTEWKFGFNQNLVLSKLPF
ncbi:hypothetical protein DICPUDRAFT_158218 [Dictyostelium purpureum]|uniref:Uncharacterized protein n=1 Tax=Dictyostelium purpureum TaxID=5786 RepID=F1A135_DICPU|nr:uncharacterized protein DICPUDRAFT_158218 [Dictyostelium purpureum]EGC30097.1 hypothetical protein DICPUDRAFT_158218 [Dictyostelium purpureum]|eukprot:XP_003293384.1 hypothetical protein DICPUDRAFT_158218 [Dictyostelium purpureum]